MRLRNLTYLLAGLFLVGACETMEEKGSAQGIGELKAKTYGGQVTVKPRPPKPKSFSITPGSGRDFVVNVGDEKKGRFLKISRMLTTIFKSTLCICLPRTVRIGAGM